MAILVCAAGFFCQHTSQTPVSGGKEWAITLSASKPVSSTRMSGINPTALIEHDENSAGGISDCIRAALVSGDLADHDLVYTNLLQLLMEKDPWAAAHFAESLEPRVVREEFMLRLTQLWAAKAPTTAESWAAQLPDERERIPILNAVCFQVAQVDAHQALLTAEKYDLGKMPGEVLENLTQQWAQQNFSTAAAWVEQQPTGEQRDQMVMRLALVQSQTDPEGAAGLVVNQIPAGPVQTEAAMTVVHQWAVRDFNGAQTWVHEFPEGPIRDHAEAELAGMLQYTSQR